MYILCIELAVAFLVCCCSFVADARLWSPSPAGFRRPPTPAIGSFSSAVGFRGGFSAGENLNKAEFNKEEGNASGGAACLSSSHAHGDAGEAEGADAAGGRRSLRAEGGSGLGFWPVGGGFAGAARRGRGGAVDLKSELWHGDEPRSTFHKAKGFSAGGELLNRLKKPALATVLARICWIDGEEGGCRDIQGPLCNFIFIGVFSAFLPAFVSVLGSSRGFRMCLVVSLCLVY